MRRIVPDIHTTPDKLEESARFYEQVLGMEVGPSLGWIIFLDSPDNPTAQLQLMTHDESAPVTPNVTVEVPDVNEVLARARSANATVVYGPADEPWGVRRFFVEDPNGTVINVMQHLHPAEPAV